MAVDFWDSATEGFNKGVALGVRNAERAEERKYRDRAETRRDEESKRQQESHDLQMRLGVKTEKATDIDLEEKEEKNRQRNFKRSYVIAKALADSGDERPAWSLVSESYNKLVNNGDEMMVFHQEDKPNLELPGGKTWKDFPDAKHLIVTRKYGAVPVKNISDALNIIEPFTDPEKFMEYERTQKASVENLNAAEKPFRGKDGKLYKKEWSLTRTGKKSKDVLYEGVEQMPEAEQKIEVVNDLVKRKLVTPEEGRILLGVREKEKQPEEPSKVFRRELEDQALLDKVSGIKDEKKQREAGSILKLFKGGQSKVDYPKLYPDPEDAIGEMSPVEEALAVAEGKIKADPVLVAKAKRLKELMTETPKQTDKPGNQVRKAKDTQGNIWELDANDKPIRMIKKKDDGKARSY